MFMCSCATVCCMKTQSEYILHACELRSCSQAALARDIGLAPSMLNQVVQNIRPLPRDAAVRLEAAVEKEFTRRDLYPADWGDYWPELIDETHPWPLKQEA